MSGGLSGEAEALEQLQRQVTGWDKAPFTVAYKILDSMHGGKVVPIVMRWSQPRAFRPVPSAYATITAAMRLQPNGRSWAPQYRREYSYGQAVDITSQPFGTKRRLRWQTRSLGMAAILHVCDSAELSQTI